MEVFGHYLFLSVCGYLTGSLCLLLAVLVLTANPKSRNCQLAFLFNFFVSVWAIFYAAMYHARDQEWGIIVSKALTFGTILLNSFFTHLVLVEMKREKRSAKFLLTNYALAALLILLLWPDRLMIQGIAPKLDLPAYTVAGPLYFLIPIYLFGNLLFSVFHLTRGIRSGRGYRRSQLLLFLTATLIGYAAGTPAFFLVFDIPIKPLTTPLVSLYPIILTYAIVKHRFLDIEKLARNTLIFSLLFFLLLGCVSAVLFVLKEFISRWIGIPGHLSQGIAIALAIGLYGPLKSGLSRTTNKLLFQHSENPDQIFRKLSEDILHLLNTRKLAYVVTRRIAEILALDRIAFYYRVRRAPYLFELESGIGRFRRKQIPHTRQLVQYLEQTRDFIVNPLTGREHRLLSRERTPFALRSAKEIKKEATKELAALGGIAAFPVFLRDSLRAILVLGRKKSDAAWRDQEFKILKSFIRHLSLAMANAEYAEAINLSRQKLALSERDASAGALIAGVDHEVKNPLHAMSLSLSALRSNLSKPENPAKLTPQQENFIAKTMEHVIRDVVEINGIIQHLSDLAERKPLKIEESVRPTKIAARVIRDLGSVIHGKKIRVESRIPDSLVLTCDPNALLEILSNLIRNAIQAIPDQGEVLVDGWEENGITILQVKDTGVGIHKDFLEKIFEPFFTTKKRGSTQETAGSGMGLFIVREYMQGMGGRVEFDSEEGKGTAFMLSFPALEPSLTEAA
jgi:signal transduction histidine kinase